MNIENMELRDRVRALVEKEVALMSKLDTDENCTRWGREEQGRETSYYATRIDGHDGIYVVRWNGITGGGISGGYETFLGPVTSEEAAARTIYELMKRDKMLAGAWKMAEKAL